VSQLRLPVTGKEGIEIVVGAIASGAAIICSMMNEPITNDAIAFVIGTVALLLFIRRIFKRL
jgi:membrane protein implicated in regulation of membrane protease activity